MRASATTLESEITDAERAALTRALAEAGLSGPHLEIGTAAGGTLKELIGLYTPQRPDFYVVDPLTYFPDQMAVIRRNLCGAGLDPDDVTFWQGTSAEILRSGAARGLTFDFIFIDGDHRYFGAMQDIAWTDQLSVGGLVAFHDDRPKFRGVGKTIRRFRARHPGYEEVARAESLVILRKTAAHVRQALGLLDMPIARAMEPVVRLGWSIEKRRARRGGRA